MPLETQGEETPKLLNAQAFLDEGLSHETQMPMAVEELSDLKVLKEEKPYKEALRLLESKHGEVNKVMVDAGLVVAAIARLFEDTRAEVEVKCIEPFFRKVQNILETASDDPEVMRYTSILKELLDEDDISQMSSQASAFANNPYATPQGFYSTPKAKQLGLDKFFRALRWLGMAGYSVDSMAQDKMPYDFEMETMMKIRKIILVNPDLGPGLESFSKYSTALAGEPDSVSMRMIDLPEDADADALVANIREVAGKKDIPKIASSAGIPFTILETAYTATQAAYEGVQSLAGNPAPSVEEFAEATNVMRAYLGGDPDYPEVGGVLNEIPKDPKSAYEVMLTMAASCDMDGNAPLALNRFACTETTAAEAVVGLEKQQLVRFLGPGPKFNTNELHLDPAITQAFVDRGRDVASILSEVAKANGVDPEEFTTLAKLSGILDGTEEMLGQGGKMYVNSANVEGSLGALKALFDQDPTAAIKVAEYMGITRVNMALPMIAQRRVGTEEFTYLSTLFGSTVQQTPNADDLLTRQKLLEMRERGEMPKNVEFMVTDGSQNSLGGTSESGGKEIVPDVRKEVGLLGGCNVGGVPEAERGGDKDNGAEAKGDKWKW